MKCCVRCGKLNNDTHGDYCQRCYKRKRQEKSPKIKCACGCGELIPSMNFDGKPMRYKSTHHIKFICRDKKPNWNNGRKKSGIYIKIRRKNHKYCDVNGYVFEHRYFMELELGRYLLPEEKIHHLDGNGINNEISNLMLFPNHSQHLKYERNIDVSDRICGICDSNKTYINKNGKPVWFIKNNQFICQRCRDRIRYDSKRKNIWRKK